MVDKVTLDEYRRRIRTNKYIVNPKIAPSLMNEREALEWEVEQLNARLLITDDPKRKPGMILRLQEIKRSFLQQEAKKAVKKVYSKEVFENELDSSIDEEEDEFEMSGGLGDGFGNEMDSSEEDEEDEEEIEETEDKVDPEEEEIIDEIKDDPLFD